MNGHKIKSAGFTHHDDNNCCPCSCKITKINIRTTKTPTKILLEAKRKRREKANG